MGLKEKWKAARGEIKEKAKETMKETEAKVKTALNEAEPEVKTALKEAEAKVKTALEKAQPEIKTALNDFEVVAKTALLTAGVTLGDKAGAKLASMQEPAAPDVLHGDSILLGLDHDLLHPDLQQDSAAHAEPAFHEEAQMPLNEGPVVDVVGLAEGSAHVLGGH